MISRELIQSSLVLFAMLALMGAAGCSCHKSTCYDGDCGLVHDNDYWEGDSGGCGAPSGHVSGCGGCGAPVAPVGCSHPHQQPTCSSCGGVHAPPAAPVTDQAGCPHCGVNHGPATEGAPPAEPAAAAPPQGTTATPPPPPLPPTIPDTPGAKAPAESSPKPVVPKSAQASPVSSQVPPPLQTVPAGNTGGVEPAPPEGPIELPQPSLENPAPIPRDATKPKWLPRRF